MDNFMDKLAQRFNAQEIIKANSQAEAQELDKLRMQMDAYDECLKEMRRLNLKNMEGLEEMHTLVGQMSVLAEKTAASMEKDGDGDEEKLEKLTAGLEEIKTVLEEKVAFTREETKAVGDEVSAVQIEVKAVQEEIRAALDEMKTLLGEINKITIDHQSKLEIASSDLEDFMHKESVKVYRNVQAVLIEELKNQTTELDDKFTQYGKISPVLYLFMVLTMLAPFGVLGIEIVRLLGLL